MATMEVLRVVESAAFERDQQEFALGDTLDIKTGLILAALTFLAIQTDDLIKSTGISHTDVIAVFTRHAAVSAAFFQWIAQFVSIAAMIVGGAYSIFILYPREYDREPDPATYMQWADATDQYRETYPDAGVEPVTGERLTGRRIENAVANVQKNLALNRRKSALMFVAFICTAVAFSANILTLAIRLF